MTASNTQPNKNWQRDLLLLTLLLSLLFTAFLGCYPLNVPDEARYAEIPREMVLSQDYITPHLNGIVYFEKPVFFYWLQSASIRTLGFNEWALRLPNALLAVMGCLVVYSAARVIYNRKTGLLACGLLATSFLYLTMGHLITLDMTVTIFLTASLLSIWLALQAVSPGQVRCLTWLSAAAAGLAVLTKGLIGIALPGLIVGSWLLLSRQWQRLKKLPILSSLSLLLIIVVPWHLLAEHANPGFLHFYLIEQHFLRYLTSYADRYQPFWFFLALLPLAWFPWIAFLPQVLLHHAKRYRAQESLFLLLWAGLILLFYSCSQSKLITYLLPALPPLAILTASYLVNAMPEHRHGLNWGFFILPVLALIISSVLLYLPRFYAMPHPLQAQAYLRSMAAVLLLGCISAAALRWRQKTVSALAALMLMMALLIGLLINALPYVNDRSIKPLAEILTPLLQAGDQVISYGTYYQDLPVYLQRRVIIVDWLNELAFGSRYQDTQDWLINQQHFWHLWHSPKKIYAITSLERYQQLKTSGKLYPIKQTTTNILFTNHK